MDVKGECMLRVDSTRDFEQVFSIIRMSSPLNRQLVMSDVEFQIFCARVNVIVSRIFDSS